MSGGRGAGAGSRVARVERVRARMAELGVDALLLSLGADLPWLTGYEAMPLERLTMLVLPADGDATLVVPQLEAPRVEPRPDVFGIRPWAETEDPVEVVAGLAGGPATDGRLGIYWKPRQTDAVGAPLDAANVTLATRVATALNGAYDGRDGSASGACGSRGAAGCKCGD